MQQQHNYLLPTATHSQPCRVIFFPIYLYPGHWRSMHSYLLHYSPFGIECLNCTATHTYIYILYGVRCLAIPPTHHIIHDEHHALLVPTSRERVHAYVCTHTKVRACLGPVHHPVLDLECVCTSIRLVHATITIVT